ncbi:unnamed protein product [Vitrella brassicaformis CCMP3155]|uniref:Uncharacterized protein n=1 Tax=Vitrella brassicaformis (strain CCMP3155) TaxID=1169540 RepID=A0A0G4GLH4_VITBC|nr:unnamed protein product [Vitrella brassicaformis CCMP3155]|eukprot:CEM30967.1 unnamed protein product [Vitrella brassicaformis CCMP3155]
MASQSGDGQPDGGDVDSPNCQLRVVSQGGRAEHEDSGLKCSLSSKRHFDEATLSFNTLLYVQITNTGKRHIELIMLTYKFKADGSQRKDDGVRSFKSVTYAARMAEDKKIQRDSFICELPEPEQSDGDSEVEIVLTVHFRSHHTRSIARQRCSSFCLDVLSEAASTGKRTLSPSRQSTSTDQQIKKSRHG